MKLQGTTIIEVLVAMVVMGIVVTISYVVLQSFNTQQSAITDLDTRISTREFAQWQVQRATLLADSIVARNTDIVFFMVDDSLILKVTGDTLLFAKGKVILASILVEDLALDMNPENPKFVMELSFREKAELNTWFFHKDYPAGLTMNATNQ